MGERVSYRTFGLAGAVVSVVFLLAACGSSGPASSTGSNHPKHGTTSSTSAPATPTTAASGSTSSSTSATNGSGSGTMVTATLPVVVCQTTSGVSTTTTSLPASVAVSVPASDAQQGNLAVYSDLTGALMLVGPTVGWTCTGTFGADGSGMMALAPVGTSVPDGGTVWHLPASSSTQAIVALESGGSTVQGAALACPLFSAAKAATQQDLGKGCDSTSPPQEHVVTTSSVQVGFQDPAGVAGVGFPSGDQNAANGIMLYQPKPAEPTAYEATCTLPAAQLDLCTAVLNHFAATFG
jgi:hypothetical protein